MQLNKLLDKEIMLWYIIKININRFLNYHIYTQMQNLLQNVQIKKNYKQLNKEW